jgi:hypothetical protein
VASFHGVSGSGHLATCPVVEQMAPLNLSKRRKSEDFGSAPPGPLAGEGGFGLTTWPPPEGSWMKRDSEEDAALNLVCREQQEMVSPSSSGPKLGVIHDDDVPTTIASSAVRVTTPSSSSATDSPANVRKLMRFSSHDGTY